MTSITILSIHSHTMMVMQCGDLGPHPDSTNPTYFLASLTNFLGEDGIELADALVESKFFDTTESFSTMIQAFRKVMNSNPQP